MTIVWNALWTVIFTAGLMVLVGIVVSTLNRAFILLTGETFGLKAVYATSFLGTPVHELSHALCCILFGHRITDMRIMTFDPVSERLGFVRHSYDHNSLYQKIGNFFIAVAPVFGGCGILLLGLMFLPGGIGGLDSLLPAEPITDLSDFWRSSIAGLEILFKTVFSKEMLSNPWWWLYCVLACSVALHINIEPAELRDGFSGLVTYALIVLVIHAVIALANGTVYSGLNTFFYKFQTFLTLILCLALIFCLICTGLALILYYIRQTFFVRRKEP